MDYKIKSLVKEGAVDAIYPNADLANCSSEYRLKYPKHIAELFEEMDANQVFTLRTMVLTLM